MLLNHLFGLRLAMVAGFSCGLINGILLPFLLTNLVTKWCMIQVFLMGPNFLPLLGIELGTGHLLV
jgi:hypothetical protein